MLSLLHVYVHMQFLLDFARTLRGERLTNSFRLLAEQKGHNPTHHRLIEQVSSICTTKSFSFLDKLLDI